LISRLLREPLLQFLAIGAMLFALHGLVGKPGTDAPEKIVVSAARIANLGDGFLRTWRRPPSAQELQDLIDVLFLPNDFPDGVILATGTGIVPELDFALAEGDVITITIDEVGTLTNTVAVGREPFTFLATDNLEGTR